MLTLELIFLLGKLWGSLGNGDILESLELDCLSHQNIANEIIVKMITLAWIFLAGKLWGSLGNNDIQESLESHYVGTSETS